MNDDLRIALDEYFETIKEIRPNYKACYNSFLKYCDRFPNEGLNNLFNNNITMFVIEQACKDYFLSSKKAKTIEAIHRFLSAMDMFYSEYLVNYDIKCEALRKGCRNQTVIKRICQSLNQELNQKIFLPLDKHDLEKIAMLASELDSDNYFQLGQKIIYQLLLTYGFKVKTVINMKANAFDETTGTLTVYTKDLKIVLKLSTELCGELKKYISLNPFSSREYLFTITNGKKLNSGSILQTLKDWATKNNIINFTPTTLALSGIANLIRLDLSFSEISKLSGFEIQKIVDVAEYLLADKDISEVINQKLTC